MRLALLCSLGLIACGPPSPVERQNVSSHEPTSDECLDVSGNGECDIELDAECMNGDNASNDPQRQEACILMALANQDRKLFVEESANAPDLIWDERLWNVAKGHADDMCERG